jgi:hypothetical protein
LRFHGKDSSEYGKLKPERSFFEMMRRLSLYFFLVLLMALVLWGCPKRPPEVRPLERIPGDHPIAKITNALSAAESLQSRTSIRIDTMRNGEEMSFLLNGYLFYQKPDRLRLLGYHSMGMGIFDALYRDGQFFLLIPFQKGAYIGEISEFKETIEDLGPIEVYSEKPEGSEIPSKIVIEIVEKQTSIEIGLKETSVNSSLPEDSFRWTVPEGVEVKPLAQILKRMRLR